MVSQKPKPNPEVIDVEKVCKQEPEDGIKKEPKREPGINTPTPGTSGIDPLEFERMRAQLERLTNLIGEDKLVTTTKKEPEEVGPATGNTNTEHETVESRNRDTDEVIQTLEDHCAKMQEDSQNSEPQNPKESVEDSGTEEKETQEDSQNSEPQNTKEPVEDSGTEEKEDPGNSGIEDVASSSQEDEIVVDPTNLIIDENSTQDEATKSQQSEADKSNNNEEPPKTPLITATRHTVTNKTDRKILIHKAPVPFPARGNLMDNPRTNTFVTEAMTTIIPDNLPGDAIVHASLKNDQENNQKVATLVLELKSAVLHDQIMRKVRDWYANDSIRFSKKWRFYITDYPQGTQKRTPSKDKEKKDRKRHRSTSSSKQTRGAPEPNTSKESRGESKAERDAREKEKIKIYKEQQEAKRAKIAHQDKETQNLIDRQAFGYKTKAPGAEDKKDHKSKGNGSPKPGPSGRKDNKKDQRSQRGSSKGTSKSLWDSPDALNALARGTTKPRTPKKKQDSPKAVTSTPMPGAPKIDPNVSTDVLEEPALSVTKRVPTDREENDLEFSTRDVSNMDMAMTVEVENDLCTQPETVQPHSQQITEPEQESRNKQKEEHMRRIDTVRRWALNPDNEDLRNNLRTQTLEPTDLRNRLGDLRRKIRRKSFGPADLRNSVLNRSQDLRGQMRPRRNRSAPAGRHRTQDEALEEVRLLEQSIVQETSHLDSRIAATIKKMRVISDRIKNWDTTSEKDHDNNITSASDSYDSKLESEGEVEPSEDEMLNVKFSDPEPETQRPVSSRVSKGEKKNISPIKFPSNSPSKNDEDVPLSRTIPRGAPATGDLRERIGGVTSPDPFNRGPVRERTNMFSPPRLQSGTPEIWNLGQRPANNYSNQITPWLQENDHRVNQDTPHHSRNFIEHQHTSREEGTMTDHGPGATSQEEDADTSEPNRNRKKHY